MQEKVAQGTTEKGRRGDNTEPHVPHQSPQEMERAHPPASPGAHSHTLPEPPEVPVGEQLTTAQKQDIKELVSIPQDIFSTLPNARGLLQHTLRILQEG